MPSRRKLPFLKGKTVNAPKKSVSDTYFDLAKKAAEAVNQKSNLDDQFTTFTQAMDSSLRDFSGKIIMGSTYYILIQGEEGAAQYQKLSVSNEASELYFACVPFAEVGQPPRSGVYVAASSATSVNTPTGQSSKAERYANMAVYVIGLAARQPDDITKLDAFAESGDSVFAEVLSPANLAKTWYWMIANVVQVQTKTSGDVSNVYLGINEISPFIYIASSSTW
jgi:hypothetical protein